MGAEPDDRQATAATVAEGPGAMRRIADTEVGKTDLTEIDAPPVTAYRGTPLAGSATSIGSPLEALSHAELLRTRNFAKVSMIIGLAGAAALPFAPAERTPTILMLAAIAIALTALVYLLYRARDPATYQEGIGVALGWYVPALMVCSAVPYFGPYSPVSLLLLLGIYVIAMGRSFGVALAVYVSAAIVQGVSGSLVIFGLGDPGFVKGAQLTLTLQIICQVLVQIVLLGGFLIARASRRSSLVALAELERAVRAVAQREALLEEAREELRGALGHRRGRFTEQMIGRYRLGDLIGRGGMGEVYESIDPRTETPVAVKMLAPTSLSNADHVKRFLRELRTAAAIESPHVVRVFEVGEQPLPHLVMERLRGRDLAEILRKPRAMGHDRVVEMLRQVGAGITAAWAAGVIHRDLKPQNVFNADGIWKVLDFGVSRLADAGDTLTAGHVVGTPAYMAPEQASGGTVDHRTDLYALAAIGYRVLTGHAPYAGGEVADVLYRVVHTAPRRPSALASLPEDVDLVFAIALAKDPANRFATAAELADAVEAALGGRLDPDLRIRATRLMTAHPWAERPPRP